MWIFFPLLCVLCAAPIHSIFEGTCPRKDPSPGVLVLSTGRQLVLTCRGRVIVDGAEVRNSSSTNKRDSSSGTSQTTVNVINTTGVLMQSGINQGNHISPSAAEENRSRGHTVSPTTHVDQPTNVQRQLNTKVGDGESVFNEEEEEWDEGSRVTRGIKSRPQWKWSGRMERKGQRDIKWMIGDELSLSSVRLTDSGVYTCYYRGRDRFSLKVIVTDPPEKPSLFCYKKSPSSKIRCESNPQESVTIRPNCYLLLSKSPKEAFHPIQCSYSSRLSRCWCTLDHNEDEMRAGHFASLCVTSIAGNVTSNLLDFTPMGILKPDPPSNVSIQQVEGQEMRLKVTWNLPSSWKSHDNFYDLIYELKYRPVMSSFRYEQIHGIKDVRSFLITDAIPGVEYQIQLRTKEEYDGVWSNWSTPVFASSWTAPETTTIMISDYVDIEGSGTDISTVDVPPTFTTVPTDVWELSTHVLWISGFFVLFSVFLALYVFRHKDRFLSKLQNLSFVPECGDSPRPLPSVPPAPEGQALMTLCPPSYKERLEGEEENEEQSPNERIEAMHFSNTSYFCVQQ